MDTLRNMKKYLICKSEKTFSLHRWQDRVPCRLDLPPFVKIPDISATWSAHLKSGDEEQLVPLDDIFYVDVTLETTRDRLALINSKSGHFLAVVDGSHYLYNGPKVNSAISFDRDGSFGQKKLENQRKMQFLGRFSRSENGQLYITITVWIYFVFKDIKETPLPMWITNLQRPEDDIANLYADEATKDFTFVVANKSFKVHKLVLSRASPVFRAMLTSGHDETKSNASKVENCKPKVFEGFVDFIYIGIVPKNLRFVSKDLYELAHKYQVKSLEDICMQDVMATPVHKFNAVELYEFAIKYENPQLLTVCWKYIKKNILEIKVACGPKPMEKLHQMLEEKNEYEKKIQSFAGHGDVKVVAKDSN